jgi:hypothetical protein
MATFRPSAASFCQPLLERAETLTSFRGYRQRARVDVPDHRRRRLLRPRHNRPRRRAAEKGDEVAALHTIFPQSL